MTHNLSLIKESHGISIKQNRGHKTYDALIETGFDLLKKKELESLTIAELAREAGYSVGAFYARFHSKDEFFKAMIATHLERRTKAQETFFATLPAETLVEEMIDNVINYYCEHKRFWRAVLELTVNQTDYWDPIRTHGHDFTQRFISRLHDEIKRPITAEEEQHIYFAFQVMLGAINASIIYKTGPVLMGQRLFVEEMTRTFKLVSKYEQLIQQAD